MGGLNLCLKMPVSLQKESVELDYADPRIHKQARLRSANMLRHHGQPEKCIFDFFLYPLSTQLGFLMTSEMLYEPGCLCSKIQNNLKTDRPTDMTRYRCFLSKHKKN